MSKKKLRKGVKAHIRQQQTASRPAAKLHEAQQALQNGEWHRAVQFAEQGLKSANDPATQAQLHQIVAESHFRLSATATEPLQRLHQIEEALKAAPDQERLHYHHALALWRCGKVEQALSILENNVRDPSGQRHLAFLQQLGKVALGKSWQASGLAAAEVNTLHFLQNLPNAKTARQPASNLTQQPLLGEVPRIWELLLQMLLSPKVAPVAEWQQTIASADPNIATNPVVNYYQGVLHLRKGDPTPAITAWQQTAQWLMTDWLRLNLLNLQREVAIVFAQQQRWQEVVTLYQQLQAQHPGTAVDEALLEAVGVSYAQLGHAAALEKQWAQAAQHFSNAIQFIPSRALYQNLALAQEAQGNWIVAADAWREMVRRRPRKTDHPDYLSDQQVAALWQHAATCYEQTEGMEEEVATCLKNAIKYAPNDLTIRMNLVDAMHGEGREDAVINELQRILEIDPNYIQALMRLAILYSNRWGADAKPIWEKVLALEPNNQEAQMALASIYVGLATNDTNLYPTHATMISRSLKANVAIIEEGLQKLPEHPLLLTGLGRLYQENKKTAEARSSYLRASQAAIAHKDLRLVGIALHELLHLHGGTQVKELVPHVNQKFPNLLSSFWGEQAERAMQCKLGEEWAEFFWDEAIKLAETSKIQKSPVAALYTVFQQAYEYDVESAFRKYESRLRKEFPQSGVVELIDALYLYDKDQKKKQPVLSLLRKARAAAQKANESELLENIDQFEEEVKNPLLANPFGGELGRIMRQMLEDFDEEELDVFRKFL